MSPNALKNNPPKCNSCSTKLHIWHHAIQGSNVLLASAKLFWTIKRLQTGEWHRMFHHSFQWRLLMVSFFASAKNDYVRPEILLSSDPSMGDGVV